MKEFQELMNQVTKAHTADLEAIQKTQRVSIIMNQNLLFNHPYIYTCMISLTF